MLLGFACNLYRAFLACALIVEFLGGRAGNGVCGAQPRASLFCPVAPQVPASIYYWLPRMSTESFGQSEVVRRWCASVAGHGRGIVPHRPHSHAPYINPGSRGLWSSPVSGLRGINYQADDARVPMPSEICGRFGGDILFLIRWLDTSHWLDAALVAVFGALVWPIQSDLLAVLYRMWPLRRPANIQKGNRRKLRACRDPRIPDYSAPLLYPPLYRLCLCFAAPGRT